MALEYIEKQTLPLNLADSIYLLFEAAITESKLYKDVWPITTAKKTVDALLNNFL